MKLKKLLERQFLISMIFNNEILTYFVLLVNI